MSEVHLFCGDCLDILPTLEAGSVDAVITDPPFYVTVNDTHGRTNGKLLQVHNWQDGHEWMQGADTLLRDGGTWYIFTNDDGIGQLKENCLGLGWEILSRLIWIKSNPPPSFTKRCYRRSNELAFFGRKGTRTAYFAEHTQAELRGWWKIPVVRGKKRTEHPTQKPLELIKDWVITSCPEGGMVLDPFMGSGTTGVACVQTGRNFIGIEIDEQYFNIAKERIEAAQREMVQTSFPLTNP